MRFVGVGGAALVAAAAFLSGCPRYKDNDLKLLVGYTAKKMCSCTFVIGQTEEFCLEWSRVDPDVKTVSIDRRSGVVETQTMGLVGARARFVDKRRGCVLE